MYDLLVLMRARKRHLFWTAILLFCALYQLEKGQAADDGAVFGLCDVGEVITEKSGFNGSLLSSEGSDCTKVILAPQGWRIKFTLHDIRMFDAITTIHDGGTVLGTLKYERGKGEAIGGDRSIVFYTSSNALLVHTDLSYSDNNTFNATFEMLPHSESKCACPPTVNGQTVCSFPPNDTTGNFYFDNDEMRKTCTTYCDNGHKIIENDFQSSRSIDTICHLFLDLPNPTWDSVNQEATLFNPSLVSCTKIIPTTQLLLLYAFTYQGISCSKVNTSVIENSIYDFLVNETNATYIGECYKSAPNNCSVKPVRAICSKSQYNPNDSLVTLEIQDNIKMAENVTMTAKQFDLLYLSASNHKQKVKSYVTTNLLMNNTNATLFHPIGFLSVYTTCPSGYVTTNDPNKKSCIACPLHTYKRSFADSIHSDCAKCHSSKRRLFNESNCVNGTQVYPKPSNINCLHKCPLGKFFNNDSGICDWCEYGYFQNSTSDLNPVCHRCPEGKTTAFVGARSENDCMYKCRKGQFTKFPSCFNCSIGYYMPYEGNQHHKCYKCPMGNTTLYEGTVNKTSCVDHCTEMGTYFNITKGVCVLCPNNTYQNETKPNNAIRCKKCPANNSALTTGATSILDCFGPCPPGNYLDAKSFSCKKCPVGTYNDESAKTKECKPCPKGPTTKKTGSTSVSDCGYKHPGQDKDDGRNPVLIIFIVLGIVAALILVATLVYCVKKHKKTTLTVSGMEMDNRKVDRQSQPL